TRGTPIGRQTLCGSCVSSRVATSALAHGSITAAISPFFRPPCDSRSCTGPPPVHTPSIRFTLPSGNRGTGPLSGPACLSFDTLPMLASACVKTGRTSSGSISAVTAEMISSFLTRRSSPAEGLTARLVFGVAGQDLAAVCQDDRARVGAGDVGPCADAFHRDLIADLDAGRRPALPDKCAARGQFEVPVDHGAV